MIDVTNKVKTYKDGLDAGYGPDLKVESHWNRRGMVWLVIGKTKVLVHRRDLEAALANATNTNP